MTPSTGTAPRVLGAVMARDEWPLLGLAIAHALEQHVDDVIVLDHASVDGTREGLARLQAAYPGRVRVVRSDAPGFPQEAATALLLQLGGAATYDWVYVFDADEFLLKGASGGLREVLAAVGDDVQAVRYELHNWVAPTSFDDLDPDAYPALRHRAVPSAESTDDVTRAIEAGELTFFDVAFPSKVVVRAGTSLWLAAGTHVVVYPVDRSEVAVAPDVLRAAHLSMPSHARLTRKARQGQAYVDAGLPPEHGWQCQLIRRVELRGDLDEFWTRHSVPDDPAGRGSRTGAPTLVVDESLCQPLAEAAARLQTAELVAVGPAEPTAVVTVDTAIEAVAGSQEAGRQFATLAHLQVGRVAAVTHERDVARAERDRLAHDLREVSERVAALIQERDRLTAERDAVADALAGVVRSRSWRITAPLRDMPERLRLGGSHRPTR